MFHLRVGSINSSRSTVGGYLTEKIPARNVVLPLVNKYFVNAKLHRNCFKFLKSKSTYYNIGMSSYQGITVK